MQKWKKRNTTQVACELTRTLAVVFRLVMPSSTCHHIRITQVYWFMCTKHVSCMIISTKPSQKV